MHIDATTDDGIITAPTPQFKDGDVLHIFSTIDLFINGDLTEVYVTSAEIEYIDLEYMVEEKEWYLNYSVALYSEGKLVKTETLSEEDVEKLVYESD